jgi:glycosyltransferase involved in cell wall biosynthesis
MKVSVVIPVYKRQKQAERALHSALSQAGPLHEVLIIDDASPEPFRLPADLKGDARIRVIRASANLGAGGARDLGCQEATGDWIAFLDSDDYWLPGKLAAQAAMATEDQRQNPGALVAYASGFCSVYAATGRRRDLIPRESSDPADFASGCWFMPGSTALVSKRALAVTGPSDRSLRRLEDLDWYMRFALAGGRLRVTPVKGAVIEIGPRPSLATVADACRRLERKWLAPNSPDRLPAAMRSRLSAYLDVERAAASRYAGNVPLTLAFLMRSFLRRPRAQVHIRRWWRPIEQAAAPGSAT